MPKEGSMDACCSTYDCDASINACSLPCDKDIDTLLCC